MKKKLIFIALLTVLLTFSFMSCEGWGEDSDDEDGSQTTSTGGGNTTDGPAKTIIITDIPSTTGYNYGYVGLSQYDNKSKKDKVVALSMPVPISGGSFTGTLISADKPYPAFKKNGDFTVVLIISTDSEGQDDVYNGVIMSKTIQEEVTTLSYNLFTYVPPKKKSISLKSAISFIE